jgi:hypothetical protein
MNTVVHIYESRCVYDEKSKRGMMFYKNRQYETPDGLGRANLEATFVWN